MHCDGTLLQTRSILDEKIICVVSAWILQLCTPASFVRLPAYCSIETTQLYMLLHATML